MKSQKFRPFLSFLKTCLAKSFILLHGPLFKLYRFCPCWFSWLLFISSWSTCRSFKASSRCLTKNTFDLLLLVINFTIVTQLVCKVTLTSLPSNVLVNWSCSPVSEKWFVIQIVVIFITKSSTKATRLIEQPLVIHDISCRWLGLS